MSKSEVSSYDHPKTYNIRESWYSPYSNILYKMARDGYGNRLMFLFLVEKLDGTVRPKTVQSYLIRFLRRNFPDVRR